MKVKDDRAWAEQLSEFESDDLSKRFGSFLVEWAKNLDVVLDQEDWYSPQFSFSRVSSKALEVTEQTLGFLSVEWIAQMLLVLTQHWEYGEQLFEGLSFIERRLVEQATALKLVELQQAASIAVEE